MFGVRRSPERGGFQLVLNGFESLIPPAFRVRRGVGNERSVDARSGPDKVVRASLHLIAGQACVHLKHSHLVAVIVFLTGNRKQNWGACEGVVPRFKQRQGGDIHSRLEGVEMRHQVSIQVDG